MANCSLSETRFGSFRMESALLTLGDNRRCPLILNCPLILDHIGLLMNIWLAYFESLFGVFYFDLNFLRILFISSFSFFDFPWFLNSFSNELWAVGLAVLFILLVLLHSSNSLINFSRPLITCSS